MAQWIKVPETDPLGANGRTKPTPTSCPLTSVQYGMHTLSHTIKINKGICSTLEKDKCGGIIIKMNT